MKHWALAATALLACMAPAWADDVTLPQEYDKLIQHRSAIGTLDGGLFGDQVGLSTGDLSFVQTDVALPGNDGLAVRVGRRLVIGKSSRGGGHFGYWDLDIPHLHGTFAGVVGVDSWIVAAAPGDSRKRCSQFAAPPDAILMGGSFSADEFWHGNQLYLPGSGDSEMLVVGATADVPTDGASYPVVTRSGAVARCVPSLAATSEPGAQGEGFEVVTPDGTVYRFDHMVSRVADRLVKTNPAPMFILGGHAPSRGATPGATNAPMTSVDYILPRIETLLYPTLVTDRFGNTVTYTWSTTNPWRLLQITASDGRQLTFTYVTDPSSHLVQSVSDGTRSWSYSRTSTTDTVTQPDGRSWVIALDDLRRARPSPTAVSCDTMSANPGTITGTITAPSGAAVQYSMQTRIFGRSEVLRQCVVSPDSYPVAVEPYQFASMALTQKTITGPGLPATGLTWSYDYGSANHCWNAASAGGAPSGAVICGAGSPRVRTTTVSAPDGAVTRYTFGNRFEVDEGLLLKEEHGWNGSTALKTVNIEYGSPEAAPYAAYNGISPRNRGDYDITSMRRPQSKVTTTQQAETFIWEVNPGCSGLPCFDFRARPTSVRRQGVNTPDANDLQYESITYHDDTLGWVLGQVAQRVVAGQVAAQTTFNANHQPWKVHAFGKLRQTLTWHPAGMLASSADGNGNTTTYGNWYRGVPLLIGLADGMSRSSVVNAQGWIEQTTDENGFTTVYGYDDMGRLERIAYPLGDSSAWEERNFEFEPVASIEHGIGAGHWRRTESTGFARAVTYYDALWRPLLVHEFDAQDAVATSRYVATAYDKAGRVADVAYPLGVAPTLASNGTWLLSGVRPNGVRTNYDALGRPTTVQQHSELGVLTTNTAYLAGFKRRVTDARTNATTEQFMAWDTPTFDWPVVIDAPEGQRTTIVRDTFGKPLQIIRGEATP